MSMLNATGKRKKAARARDREYMRDVADSMWHCMGTGIFNLFHNAKAINLIPEAVALFKKPAHRKHPSGGTVEKLGFPRGDSRHPRHKLHMRTFHPDLGLCDCVGPHHRREALKYYLPQDMQ